MAKTQLEMFESELLRSILGIAGAVLKGEEKEKGGVGGSVLCGVLREVSGGGSRNTRPPGPKSVK